MSCLLLSHFQFGKAVLLLHSCHAFPIYEKEFWSASKHTIRKLWFPFSYFSFEGISGGAHMPFQIISLFLKMEDAVHYVWRKTKLWMENIWSPSSSSADFEFWWQYTILADLSWRLLILLFMVRELRRIAKLDWKK